MLEGEHFSGAFLVSFVNAIVKHKDSENVHLVGSSVIVD